MDTIRQKIMNAVKTRFQNITTANGYTSNLGNNVFEWKTTAIPQANLPVLIYRDVSSEYLPIEMGHSQRMNIEAEVIVSAGTTTITEVRKLIADIYKAIGVDTTWGGLAINTIPQSDEIIIEQTEKVIGGAMIRFAIDFRTKEWNQYQQL